MNSLANLLQQLPQVEAKLGYQFKDSALLVLAFTHRSFVNEQRQVSQHNERLEFLGDSVLGMLISEYLYKSLPLETPEGELSNLRARLVEAAACMAYMQKLDLSQYLLLGKGERMNDGRGRDSILADLLEAIVGAIYLDGGIEPVRAFIFTNFSPEIASILKMPLTNWKAHLQDYCQKKYQHAPQYKVLEESGPDHAKTFVIAVMLDEQPLGCGTGSSKKEAQQAAAADALKRLLN
jgi:ribonuclease III